jgi:cell division protein ZapA
MESKPAGTEVEIFGQTYILRATAEPSYIQELAAFVDQRMREVAARTVSGDHAKIAILAALNISDDLYQLRLKTQSGDPGRFVPKAGRLVEKLDEILGVFPREVPAGAGSDVSGSLRGS